ncbi:dNTP triphosphohydrolase [Corallococcus interemptor]|uniref:DNTP triphosphohydrolase n=1 Tax=Corallococcus interemptor TaxID=2316720 RepID=A0A3A8QIT9_9BACT|nr:dNTP triphosphohydrolase [Corallococcus interemptor]RKH67641.1 dNTP triphosphohydrolase [Corallococcus interemptor]
MSRDDNQERTERWRRLLSDTRVGSGPRDAQVEDAAHRQLDERNDYSRDYDRIVFSSEFRCLHDKTQVFPLSTSDYTRTRLTHSIEASCVGRSLGHQAGLGLKAQGVDLDPSHLGTIVAAACLAHDIGNPPFGHSGEAAIQHWVGQRLAPPGEGRRSPFATEAEWRDLRDFEGNAQGFRILNRLQSRERRGGLRYTAAMLGAMSKYPRPSVLPGSRQKTKGVVSERKFGYFQDDLDLALEAFRATDLREREPGVFSRHPLAFLVEAADDICYAVIDLEDSAKLGLVPLERACELLDSVLPEPESTVRKPPRHLETRLAQARARVIGKLIPQCVEAFVEHALDLEAGRTEQSLTALKPDVRAQLDEITGFTREHGYWSERVLQIESAGFKTLGGLLDMFALSVVAESPNAEERKLRQLLPLECFQRPEFAAADEAAQRPPRRDEAIQRLTPYQRLLCVTDYITGLSDSRAVELYQRLSGIQLPS